MPKNEERGAEATSHVNSTKRSKPTQEDIVLNYLREHGELTTLTAVRELFIMNPQQRIRNLRMRGHNICTVYRTAPSGVKYGVYILKEAGDVR